MSSPFSLDEGSSLVYTYYRTPSPAVPDWASPIWHIFPIRHPHRDHVQEYLNNAGIGTLIHYPVPPHLSGAYADLGLQKGAFPIAETISSTVLSLPMGPHLRPDDIEYVVSTIREYGKPGE